MATLVLLQLPYENIFSGHMAIVGYQFATRLNTAWNLNLNLLIPFMQLGHNSFMMTH